MEMDNLGSGSAVISNDSMKDLQVTVSNAFTEIMYKSFYTTSKLQLRKIL